MSDHPTAPVSKRMQALKLYSPSAARNRQAICDVLEPRLPQDARVLEIGSGTGEHAATLLEARPDIFWQPTDPDPEYRSSQTAWAQDFNGRMAQPLELDLCDPGWDNGLEGFDALVCINVIHISPITVLNALAARAASIIKPEGLVFLYGPYKEGEKTAPSNLDFDRSLKSRNPQWGVRDLDLVIRTLGEGGFAALTRTDMPANNLSLIFQSGDPSNASS